MVWLPFSQFSEAVRPLKGRVRGSLGACHRGSVFGIETAATTRPAPSVLATEGPVFRNQNAATMRVRLPRCLPPRGRIWTQHAATHRHGLPRSLPARGRIWRYLAVPHITLRELKAHAVCIQTCVHRDELGGGGVRAAVCIQTCVHRDELGGGGVRAAVCIQTCVHRDELGGGGGGVRAAVCIQTCRPPRRARWRPQALPRRASDSPFLAMPLSAYLRIARTLASRIVRQGPPPHATPEAAPDEMDETEFHGALARWGLNPAEWLATSSNLIVIVPGPWARLSASAHARGRATTVSRYPTVSRRLCRCAGRGLHVTR